MLSPNQAVADGCHRCQFCGHVFPQISHTFFLPDLIPISTHGHLHRRLTPCVLVCVVLDVFSGGAKHSKSRPQCKRTCARSSRGTRKRVARRWSTACLRYGHRTRTRVRWPYLKNAVHQRCVTGSRVPRDDLAQVGLHRRCDHESLAPPGIASGTPHTRAHTELSVDGDDHAWI